MLSSTSAKCLPRHFSSSLSEYLNLQTRKHSPFANALRQRRALFMTSILSKNAPDFASPTAPPSWNHVSSSNENASSLPKNGKDTRTQRQTMSAREIRVFDEMFDMIFDSTPSVDAKKQTRESPLDLNERNSVLIGRLRRHSRRMNKTTEVDEILDRKKQEIALCRSDQELLEWAMTEVFAESQRYSEEAKQSQNSLRYELQPPAYSQLVALLMRIFRDQYRDPYLALSIFEHAKSLSTASYVFGCSTLAYNELIQTRWTCFRDLKGVHNALQEMRINGVEVDSQTRFIVENLRRQIGDENLWVNDSDADTEEVWKIIAAVDSLISSDTDGVPKRRKWRDWKEVKLNDRPDDNWEFGDWTLRT